MLIPFIDCKIHKRCPRLLMYLGFVLIDSVQTQWRFYNAHTCRCWKWPKSETNFWKECIITEKWKTAMPPNRTHKILHSSAMYYQNLNVIRESSKKLLKPKDSFGEFQFFFFLIIRKFRKLSENTTRHSCNCVEWHIVLQYCTVANYHYVHNLWQSIRGDSKHFDVLVISRKWKHFKANC